MEEPRKPASSHFAPMVRAKDLPLKYALDRVLAVLLLPFLALPMLGLAAAIKLDDGGPVFFRQWRVGLAGRPFRIWKFRTMIPEAEVKGKGYVPEGSDFVTGIGTFLRRTSLDEIPQIFNILSGEMSFVGPRPAVESQVVRYAPVQQRRLEVKPGIMGLAQLRGRNTITWGKRIEYDLEYVQTASIVTDIRIALASIPAVLRGRGVETYQSAEDVDDLGGDSDG